MLTEDEALSWFKSSPGSSRIDFLCRVLRFCSPLELRYLAVVLEDVCRKDHHELQNIEHQLNNVVAFSSLAEAVDSGLSLLDKATRHKLLTALALLRSDNRSIGEKLFDVLLHSLEPNGTLKEDAIVYEEALLLLLMAANHPAFRFDHRKRLWQRIEQFSKGSTTPYEEKSESSRSSSKVTRWLETIDVTGIQKRSGQKKDFEFTMEVQWSDGSTSIVSKTYLELFDFQHKLLNAFPAEGGQVNKKNRIIPFLPGRKILSTITPRELAEKRLPEIADYAQKLVELPRHVSQSSLVLEFFEAEHVDFDGTVPDALAEAWKDVVLPSKSNSLYSFTDHVGSEEENREEEETATKEEDHGDGNFASADTNDNDGDGDGNDVFSPGATSAQDSYIYYNDTEDDAAKAVPLIGAPPAALYHSFYPGAPPLPPMYFPPQGGNFSFRPPPFAPPPSPHHSIPPYPHHPYFNKLPHQLHSNRHSYPSPQPRSNTRSPRQRQHPPVVEDDRRSSPSPTSSSGSAPTSQFRNKVTLSATSSLSSPVGNRQRKSSSSSPGPKPHSSDVKTFYDWLKSLRLHKYYKKFGDVSFEEICQFSEEDLESLGLTEGPRRKFIKNREFLKNNPDFKGFEENGSHPSLHKSQSDLDLDSLSMSEASTSLQELRVDAAAGEEEDEENDKKKRDETAAAAAAITESDPPLVSETFPYDDSEGRFGDIGTQNKAVGMPPYSASFVLPPHAMYRLNEALLYPPPPLPPFHQSVYGGPPFHASFVPVQQQHQRQTQDHHQQQQQQGQGQRQQQGQRPVANYIGPKEKSCFNCGEIGHVGIQCTQSKGKLSSFSMNLSSKQLDGKKS